MWNAWQEVWFRFAMIRKILFSVFRCISSSYLHPALYPVFLFVFSFFNPNDEQNYNKEIKLSKYMRDHHNYFETFKIINI